MVGMGYAIADNVLHVLSGDTEAATLRMITAAPANAVFAVIMGFFLGEAKRFGAKSITFSLVALLLAAIAHGYYDYFMTLAHIKALWLQALVSLAIVVVLTQLALKSRKISATK
jgi:RsiW-degrading membrane proteinase PrsW (M82 family)